MALASGTRLGPYEILAPAGAGGMGEVYRARDTRLDRTVAIKVLSTQMAGRPDLHKRFEREARTISKLSHPHICAIYDVGRQEGVDFLVMEYLEGETLGHRLLRGPLPPEQTRKHGMEIAEALEAAHRQGIIHRDLKPGNVMLTKGGAKLMDFGLAKLAEQPAPMAVALSELADAPTAAPREKALTEEGVIVGTFQYMAPEQLEGKDADARTDIFALGMLLYEMATGRPAFTGRTKASVIAAILTADPPPISSLQPLTPSALDRVVKTCLAKDPEERFSTAHDVKLELKWIAEAPAATGPAITAAPWKRRREWGVALLAGAVMASAIWLISGRSSNLKPAPMHLSIALAPGAIPTAGHFTDQFAISPDGSWMVYVVAQGGKQQLFFRAIREPEGRPIQGTDDADYPFISPDSLWIGFHSGNTLKKIPVSGGAPIAICTLPSSFAGGGTGFIGGAWGPDNNIVFVPQFNAGIWTVSANGGTPQVLLKTDEEKDRIAYIYLQVLPDNKGILFTIVPGRAVTTDEGNIAVLEPGALEPRILVRGGSRPQYVRTGHLLYGRGGDLLAVPFDLARLAVTGTPVTVLAGFERNPVGASLFSVSENGTLLYEPDAGLNGGSRLVVMDRKGNGRPITDGNSYPLEFSLSPDGRQVAADVVAVNNDVWTYDVAHGTPLRLTFEAGDEIFPQWTPDGKRIAFGTRAGKIFWKSADGTGEREELSRSEFPRYPGSFSPDGKRLAFVEIHPSRQRDIWLMPLEGDRKAQAFQTTDADEWGPKFSPNGRWLAYVSNESGRDEIYVRPIGSPGGRKRVSTEGGSWPAWARSGRELFFLKGDRLVAVTLDADSNPAGGERVVLDAPRSGGLQFQADSPFYDVMPDGEHFVVLLSPQYPSPTHYNVVLNWFEELKHAVPGAK
ncbi:MAG: serine/threonine-protein kinase [Acidobacteriales bacterium]|nr:serine/threonine-protein kinase [Terriglobales bacterium]